MAAVDGWLDGDFLARAETCDAFADGFDGSAEFMADGDGDFLLGYGVVAGWGEARREWLGCCFAYVRTRTNFGPPRYL